MSFSFAALATIDLETIPDDVLLGMSVSIREEVSRRRLKKIDRTDLKIVWGVKKGWQKVASQPYHKTQHGILKDLIAEDWSDVYPRTGGERKFYVYAHINPRAKSIDRINLRAGGILRMHLPGAPFYIGKGCGDRAWDLSRNEGHGVELRALSAMGVGPGEIAHIIKDGLTESEALELESKLILFFGTRFGVKRRGLLVNLDTPRVPIHLR